MIYLVFNWLGDGHVLGLYSSVEIAEQAIYKDASTYNKVLVEPEPDNHAYGFKWYSTYGNLEFHYSIEEFNLDETKYPNSSGH